MIVNKILKISALKKRNDNSILSNRSLDARGSGSVNLSQEYENSYMTSDEEEKTVKTKIYKKKKIKPIQNTKESTNTEKVKAHFEDMKNLYHRVIDVNNLEYRFNKEKENLYLISEYGQRIYNFKRKQ